MFTQVVICINSLFLLTAEQYSLVLMYHCLFSRSPIERHLSCFQLLAIINEAAMNTCVHIFVWTSFPFFCDKCPRMKVLGLMVVKQFFFKNCQTVFQSRVAVPLYVSTSNVWVINFLYILVRIWWYHCFFYFGHFDGCLVMSHYSFNLHIING